MKTFRHTLHPVALALASLSLPAFAADFDLGNGAALKVNATVTAGTMIRTEAPDPAVYGAVSGALVGMPAGSLGGNANSSDLNFRKNKPVSTVLKGVADSDISRQGLIDLAHAMLATIMAGEQQRSGRPCRDCRRSTI